MPNDPTPDAVERLAVLLRTLKVRTVVEPAMLPKGSQDDGVRFVPYFRAPPKELAEALLSHGLAFARQAPSEEKLAAVRHLEHAQNFIAAVFDILMRRGVYVLPKGRLSPERIDEAATAVACAQDQLGFVRAYLAVDGVSEQAGGGSR